MTSDGRPVLLLSRHCLALVLHRTGPGATGAPPTADGRSLFAELVRQNALCYWNACLARSVASLEYRGCLAPCTLLVAGSEFALEVVRCAWGRRVLRPPRGYLIHKLGDIGVLEMSPVPQTQFAPLSEALCKVVADLNGDRMPATTTTIRNRLEDNFPEMQVPSEDILYKTLGGLIRERKLYHTGEGYSVVTPDTYRQRAVSPLCERQMLMTNEEAIVKLHGQRKDCSLAVQVDELDIAAAWKCSTSSFLAASTQRSAQVPSSPDLRVLERSHSLKVLRVKGRTRNNEELSNRGSSLKDTTSAIRTIGHLANDLDMADISKSEKQSMLARLLKRMQSLTDKPKHVTFSAQFPPSDWLDAENLHCHSVATQTQLLLQKVYPKSNVLLESARPKIPWEETTGFHERKTTPDSTSPNIYNKLIQNDSKVPLRPQASPGKPSPSHRHSGTYAKRRYRHRRSSSDSSKPQKPRRNHSQSTSSKSTEDQSEDKASSEGCPSRPKDAPTPVPTSPTAKPVDKPAGKLATCESSSDTSVSCKPDNRVSTPVPLKSGTTPVVKEIIVDNSVSVEVALEKVPAAKGNNVSTTVVTTEETTVTKGGKVVTVTSITTSLSQGSVKKDSNGATLKDEHTVNDLNIETTNSGSIIDCTSSCNIVTEVK